MFGSHRTPTPAMRLRYERSPAWPRPDQPDGRGAGGSPQRRHKVASLAGHLEDQIMLDAIDTQIVECLQVEGRASWTQIARQIGVPTSTAFRRGTALLEGNAILIATLPSHPVAAVQAVAA